MKDQTRIDLINDQEGAAVFKNVPYNHSKTSQLKKILTIKMSNNKLDNPMAKMGQVEKTNGKKDRKDKNVDYADCESKLDFSRCYMQNSTQATPNFSKVNSSTQLLNGETAELELQQAQAALLLLQTMKEIKEINRTQNSSVIKRTGASHKKRYRQAKSIDDCETNRRALIAPAFQNAKIEFDRHARRGSITSLGQQNEVISFDHFFVDLDQDKSKDAVNSRNEAPYMKIQAHSTGDRR